MIFFFIEGEEEKICEKYIEADINLLSTLSTPTSSKKLVLEILQLYVQHPLVKFEFDTGTSYLSNEVQSWQGCVADASFPSSFIASEFHNKNYMHRQKS